MKRTRFRSQCQLPLVGGLLLILSASAHSVILDDEWGDWYGNTGMAWDLNANNSVGEKLTLSCSGGRFHLDVATPDFPEVVGTHNYVKYMALEINQQPYNVSSDPEDSDSQKLFDALKKTSNSDTLQFTSLQVNTSPFSANGLADAMADTTYQECLEHP